MTITYKFRLKDRRARKALTAYAYAVNQVWNWCVAQHRDAIDRHHSGAPRREWRSAFSLGQALKGVGRELNLSQTAALEASRKWVATRSTKFRSSFGARRARGWIPFRAQCVKLDGNSFTYRGDRYRFFGGKSRLISGRLKGGAFVEDSLGRWWICFNVEVEPTAQAVSGEVGIDLGLKDFASLSDGRKFESPWASRRMAGKRDAAQRANNSRRNKAICIRAANVRRDFHHKLSTSLARDYAFIAVGNVNAKRLARTRMAKSVLDAGWSSFRNMLAYKATRYVEVDEKFTTQTCSSCGSLPPERPKGIAGLGIRSWDCSACGASHDRDVNAALNILRIGRSVTPLVEENRRAVVLGPPGRLEKKPERLALAPLVSAAKRETSSTTHQRLAAK